MNVLAIDRSTDVQSVALVRGEALDAAVFDGMDSRSGAWPVRVRDFLAGHGVAPADLDRIVVGQGPGSFAGIRAALAFAQGIALGSRARVAGLPSSLALAHDDAPRAVVGDARRGRYWVILYAGVETARDFTLVSRDGLAAAVPAEYAVVTSDGARLDALLGETFGARYLGNAVPQAARLAELARRRPDLLRPEPLPIYLQAAVRA